MYTPPNNHCFIDGNNLHNTYTDKYFDWKIDYQKLRTYLFKKHRVTVAHYFIGYIPHSAFAKLYENLDQYGYTLQQQNATQGPDGKYKYDCDQHLINTARWTISKYDQAIIISSDHHYLDLIKELDDQSKLKLVLAPCRAGCSKDLKRVAGSKIAYIDDLKDRIKFEG
jgi:hypothetical protein